MKLEVPVASYYLGFNFFNEIGIPIRIIHIENGKNYPNHSHEFEEIVIVYEGKGSHFINDIEYSIKPGDVFLISKGQIHRYENLEKLSYINVLFDRNIILQSAVSEIFNKIESTGLNLNMFERNNAAILINTIDNELYNKKEAYTQMALIHLMQLICLIYRSGQNIKQSEDSTAEDKIKNIISYLNKENGPEISIETMAAEAGTCKRNFHRIFHKLTGQPPQEYITRLRIAKACELLVNTEKTITNIAAMVNYSDSNYFARQFKTMNGVSPRAYRNLQRKSSST